jgi:molybdenum cofactor cytidylyltransferase
VIAAIVLAAGLGRRMGAIKPLLEIDGEPLLTRVLHAIDAAGVDRTIVVLGRSATQIRSRVDLSLHQVVVNSTPELGLSSSLRLGIAELPADADGVLVFHADMPYVSPATIRAVRLAAVRGARVSAPRYRGVRGFPVYFARSCFSELLDGLCGDAGGRELLEEHPEWVELVDVEDPGSIRDLDRPTDLISPQKETSCATSE